MTSRLALALVAVTVAVAAAPAAAFVRTTDPNTNACVFWPSRSVTYHINSTRADSSPSCEAPVNGSTAAVDAVRQSFATWTTEPAACSDLSLNEGAETTEIRVGAGARGGTDENIVVFRSGWCTNVAEANADPRCTDDPNDETNCGNIYNCFEDNSAAERRTIALTTVSYYPSSGLLVDADIEIVDWDGVGIGEGFGSTSTGPAHGWYFTCGAQAATRCTTYGQPSCHYMDLQNTITHEVGHFIGLGHEDDVQATMNSTAGIGETWKRVLQADDVTGLCQIYPTGETPLTCTSQGSNPSSSSSSGGCASGGSAAGFLSSLLAAAALWPRRRAARPRA